MHGPVPPHRIDGSRCSLTPRKSRPEHSDFRPSVRVPVPHYRDVSRDPAKRKSLISSWLVHALEHPGAIGVQNPEEPLPEESDLAGSAAVPVTDHGNVARDAAESMGPVEVLLKHSISVVIQDPEESLAEQPDLGASISVPVSGYGHISGLGTYAQVVGVVVCIELTVPVGIENE